MSSYAGLCPDCRQIECDEACMKATSNVELLPLPSWAHKADKLLCDTDWLRTQVSDYARACVAHATAAKDAEIEALRAEVAEARDGWHMANGTADLAMKHRDVAEAHAEQLAEALRDLLSWFPEKPAPSEWRILAGEQGADDAIEYARAALTPTEAADREP